MTENEFRPGKHLRGEARLKAATTLKERYEAGASLRQLADDTGRSAGGLRGLLALAGTTMRPSGGSSDRGPAKKRSRRVIVKVKRAPFKETPAPTAPTGPLNKSGLAEAVAADLGIPIKDGFRVLDAVFGAVGRTVTAGHDVTVTNFGTFRAIEQAARLSRNPQTGERVPVPARPRVRFRVSPRLSEVVQGGDPSASLKKRPSK